MKKILFITIRNPFSQYFSGDVIRAKKFIAFLSKKNIIDVLSLNHKNDNWKKKNITYRGIKKKKYNF